MPAHISPTSGIQIMCQPRSIRQKAEKANTHSQKVITIDEHIKVKNIWATVGHTMLLLDDKKNILQGGWLTNNILFAAEQLLCQQFPTMSGFARPFPSAEFNI